MSDGPICFVARLEEARTNRIARIRYGRLKGRLKELVVEHKNLAKEWLKGEGNVQSKNKRGSNC